MKPFGKPAGISLWLFLLIPGVFGAEEVAGQIPKQSSANAAVSDRTDSMAEPAGYWIFLDGKPDTSPVEISERALARRARRGQPYAAELDRNVSPTYIRALEELGVEIQVESRWLNAVSAVLTEESLARVRQMDFVRDVRPLARRKTTFPEPVSGAAPVSKTAGDRYGLSRTQLALMNAIAPLERGINGKGVRIGFLDTPFYEFNHPVFDSLRSDGRLIEIRNFTGKTDDPSTHGMQVASVAVGYQEGELIGPAHAAEVLAGATEYTPTETNQEEHNLVAGLEWMESEGVDVVNISLGYTDAFNAGQNRYTVSDLDGDTGITTIAVDQAAALGVVVVTSAGNSGDKSWYYISTPADADSAITVGAVRRDSSRAPFSSFGPTADGRIKPDVSAMGVGVYLARPGNRFSRFGNGTSYSSPLTAAVVAQMLQVNPDLAPMDVLDILRSTAHQSESPDNSLGWGIVNADEAIKMAESMADPLSSSAVELPTETALLGNYPNPFNPETTIRYMLPQTGKVHLAVYNLLGHEVAVLVDESKPAGHHATRFEAGNLPSGAYLYRLQTQDRIMAKTMILVK
ncbi:MAG: S8 family serine peptidase [Bacteroidetes bacterium SB0662_bin_6]|nr:S8 family serine peptidase [Bacteroidetes bacterium SB0668_bin_1]MYE05266.1 S8 family serine peptidase [Bacteroidetes bacterium SB0662_bin_6]